MNEEEYRAQRMAAMQEQAEKQKSDEANRSRIEQQLNTLLATILTPEAKARLANVRLVNYEKYLQVAQALVMLYQQGRISGKVGEEHVKQLLIQLSPKKKDITIKRK